jgi:tRNA(Ile)-lysidine synthase
VLDFLKRLNQFIVTNSLCNKGDKIIVACSGGADSVVLANALHHAGYTIALAHCNFQLRGKESDEDEAFVKQLSASLNIQFFCIKFNTKAFATDNNLSIQESARKLRYDWFEQLRNEIKFHKIAVAHHANDSVETSLINLIRGTGINGLKGIEAKNGRIIRPLLFAQRSEIEQFAAINHLNFRTDSSNLSNDYLRNAIRNSIIKAIENEQPSFQKIMLQNIQNFNAASKIYNQEIEKKRKSILKQLGNQCKISLPSVINYHSSSTLLFELIYPFGFNHSQALDILSNKIQSGKVFLSATHRAIIHQKNLLITEIAQPNADFYTANNATDVVTLSNGSLLFKEVKYTQETLKATDEFTALLDAKHIKFPLIIRKWQQGDYFYPFGMNGKKKKLSDFFTSKKISLIEKENTWLICSNQHILWVVGMRIDERFKITEATKNILKIEWKKGK